MRKSDFASAGFKLKHLKREGSSRRGKRFIEDLEVVLRELDIEGRAIVLLMFRIRCSWDGDYVLLPEHPREGNLRRGGTVLLGGGDLNHLDSLFIENVGNLVCPSS